MYWIYWRGERSSLEWKINVLMYLVERKLKKYSLSGYRKRICLGWKQNCTAICSWPRLKLYCPKEKWCWRAQACPAVPDGTVGTKPSSSWWTQAQPHQGWAANHATEKQDCGLVLECSALLCLPQQPSTKRSCWTSWWGMEVQGSQNTW